MIKLETFGIYGNEERMAPLFALSAGNKREIKLWDYKQRQPLIIYFVNKQENDFLLTLNQQYAAYQKENIELLVITGADKTSVERLTAELNLQYPLLADPDFKIHSRYIKLTYPEYETDEGKVKEKPVAVFVLDRFGSIFRYATAASVDKLPEQSEMLSSHEFISCLCNP